MFAGAPQTIGIGPETALDGVLAGLPDAPAVFLIWGREGAPYLARTALLRRRLRRLLRAREGASRLLNLRGVAARIEYWLVGSRLESGLVFYELAARHFPQDYLKLTKLRMPPYLKVMLVNPFPRTQVTTRLSGGAALFYGPFRNRGAAELFESRTLDLFQVRRCQEELVPSPQHPGCIYGEMGMCLRPCQQAVSEAEYRSEVDRLVAFLQTAGRSLREPLSAARERLSQELAFEEASRVHKQLEKIEQALDTRDQPACDIDRLHGVAVARSAAAGEVALWFVLGGSWLEPVRLGFEVREGKTVSIDQRLREIVARLARPRAGVRERQEHLALFARWYYGSWRDGEWIGWETPERVPYRRLVRAISRAVAPAREG